MIKRSIIIENPIYEVVWSLDGGLELGDLITTEQITLTELFADSGKHFVRRSDGAHLANIITLGSCDSADNYIEAFD